MSRLTLATIVPGTDGFIAKYWAPSRPFSSAVRAANTTVRLSGGPFFNIRAASSSVAIPLALSSAPLLIVSSSIDLEIPI